MANTTSKSAPQLDANFSISNDPPTEELYYGSIKVWKNKDGQFHRDGGLPAIEFANGNKFYYKNGKNHRDGVDLPAIEFANGDRSYFRNGVLHRSGNKPAVITKTSYEYWIDGRHVFTLKHNNGIMAQIEI